MRVLVMGWTKIPHSYSIVNVFQLVHLRKNFPDLKLYIREEPYFRKEWATKTSDKLYPAEYYDILDSIEIWNGHEIDLIYSITYPYDINSLSISSGGSTKPIPKCVFYTSEFGKLDVNYFKINTSNRFIDDDFIQNHLHANKSIHFTCPSRWSQNGMKKYLVGDDSGSRNVVISHGVDTGIFKRLENGKARRAIRKLYKVSDTDILLCNIGAMTKNKGITLILEALKVLVIDQGKTHYKLLLKGMQDLYATRTFLDSYLLELGAPKSLYDNIIFLDNTLSCTKLNEIYNSIDLYLSPYIAEGFNLVPLEVMAAGTRVVLPRGGSTKEYTDILEGYNCISFVNCTLDIGSGCNQYKMQDLIDCIVNTRTDEPVDFKGVSDCISEKLSWNVSVRKLVEYFDKIV